MFLELDERKAGVAARKTLDRSGIHESKHVYLNVQNENESENKNASGGTCARGAKRPRVGRLPRCVFVFAVIYVELSKYIFTF